MSNKTLFILITKNIKFDETKIILRAGVEPATYGFLTTCYSPPLYQLSYRRRWSNAQICVYKR